MATITIDGLWPSLQSGSAAKTDKAAKTFYARFLENQQRRAQFRIDSVYAGYSVVQLRNLGVSENEIRRVKNLRTIG